ncbi:transmembrane protein 203 [Tetranychus urticae]|uniref:Uncharacterized protein n=1 Tax=Tetranychus urticae TaxID=32264 RepID=T1JRN8_TETUR|nr:transmembrane protein 203 [Tetranychus urticae]
MFTLKELVNWFGVTVFELIIITVAIFFYTITIAIKLDGFLPISWWFVHLPLFLADFFLAYFCVIVFIRQCLDCLYRTAFFRAFWSFNQIAVLFTIKFFLCLKLEGDRRISCSEIWAPIFFHLLLLMLRGCQIH